MFRRQNTIAISLLAALLIWVVISGLHVSENDRLFYQMLLESSSPASAENTLPVTYTQKRLGNSKEGWITDGAQRLHFKLLSDVAALQLTQLDSGGQIVEHMDDLECWMQEALYYTFPDGTELLQDKEGGLLVKGEYERGPSVQLSAPNLEALAPIQRIRYLKAKKADYYYGDHLMMAQHVDIERFLSTGHSLSTALEPQKPLMTGFAESLEFTFENHLPLFRAFHMRAEFQSTQGLL